MKVLLNALVAVICWLGLCVPNLILPFARLPVEIVLEALTAVDYLLLVGCFVAVTIFGDVFDFFTKPARQRL